MMTKNVVSVVAIWMCALISGLGIGLIGLLAIAFSSHSLKEVVSFLNGPFDWTILCAISLLFAIFLLSKFKKSSLVGLYLGLSLEFAKDILALICYVYGLEVHGLLIGALAWDLLAFFGLACYINYKYIIFSPRTLASA